MVPGGQNIWQNSKINIGIKQKFRSFDRPESTTVVFGNFRQNPLYRKENVNGSPLVPTPPQQQQNNSHGHPPSLPDSWLNVPPKNVLDLPRRALVENDDHNLQLLINLSHPLSKSFLSNRTGILLNKRRTPLVIWSPSPKDFEFWNFTDVGD
jgi:hypothetical protein